MSLWHFLTYFSVIWFLVLVVSKIIKIATAPVHLRWELYPVPHEKGRAEYGGSRLEEVDWWTKPAEKDMAGEIKAMGSEILLLKGVWEHNIKLWIGSFPFHFALYLYIANTFLLILAGILQASGIAVEIASQGLPGLLALAIITLGWAGAILGVIGAVILLGKRIFDPALSNFATASHFFNIILIGGLFTSALIWMATDENFIANIIGFFTGIVTFSSLPQLPAIGYIDAGITLFFMVYLPLTHMTHFFAKYFTYHHVRWNDAPNIPGGKMADRIAQQLNQPVSWAAPHIGADGRKNWIAIASSMPGKENGNGKKN